MYIFLHILKIQMNICLRDLPTRKKARLPSRAPTHAYADCEISGQQPTQLYKEFPRVDEVGHSKKNAAQLNYSNRIRLNQDCCLKCQWVVKLCKTATARNTPPRLLRFSALPVFWRGLLEQKPGTACYPQNINQINQQHETTQCSRLRGSLVDGQLVNVLTV